MSDLQRVVVTIAALAVAYAASIVIIFASKVAYRIWRAFWENGNGQ